MMDRMEDAAARGDMAEAQRLLDQLNNIMENLKSAKRGSQQNQATREMNRSMNDLNRMMQEQGDVRDKTFQRNREVATTRTGCSSPTTSRASARSPSDNGDGQQPGDQPGRQGRRQARQERQPRRVSANCGSGSRRLSDQLNSPAAQACAASA